MNKRWTEETIKQAIAEGKVKRQAFHAEEPDYVPPFRKAVHFIHRNLTWVLVHGRVNKIPNKWQVLSKVESTPHAWCESEDMVYDPEFNLYMKKDNYYRLFKVSKKVKKYSASEMTKMLKMKRRYGRWEEVLWFE